MMQLPKICLFKKNIWATLLFLTIFVCSCAELDGVFPKFEPNKKREKEESLPTSLSVSQKQNTLSEENRVLHKKFQKLQRQVLSLQKNQEAQREDFILLREQWEMNFLLLERSVEESLNSRNDSVVESSIESEYQVGRSNQSINKKGSLKKSGLIPIEDYSLLKKDQGKKSEENFENNKSLQESTLNFEDNEIEIFEEPGFTEPARVNLNDLEESVNLPEPDTNVLLSSMDSSENFQVTNSEETSNLYTFSDQNLNPPENPLILIRHPGVKKIYNQGMTALIQKNHLHAIRVFENFTKRFPNNIDSDNAFYWIGRSFYELGEYKKAEQAFRKVLTIYEHRPTSQGYKTPDSIYMLGKLQRIKKRAQYYWREVIKRYPGSAAARNAKRELKK